MLFPPPPQQISRPPFQGADSSFCLNTEEIPHQPDPFWHLSPCWHQEDATSGCWAQAWRITENLTWDQGSHLQSALKVPPSKKKNTPEMQFRSKKASYLYPVWFVRAPNPS